VIRYLCTEVAEGFLDANPELESCNLELLVERLEGRFQRKISKTDAYSELLAIKQDRSTIEEYAGRLEGCAAALANVITELQKEDTREELLASVFVSGLNPTIQKSMAAADYKTFDDCVRSARKCERLFEDDRPRRPICSIAEQEIVASPREIKCWECNQTGHTRRECKRTSPKFWNKGRG
jgi:hypothetical protein